VSINLDAQPVECVSFRASVAQDGTLRMEEPGRWRAWLSSRKGKLLTVTVERRKQQRSAAQNRYYHGCVVAAVADVLNVDRVLPIAHDDVHDVLKRAFLGHQETALGPVAKSSRALSIEEFHDYVERIRAWAAQTHGLDIPDPGSNWEAA